MAAKRHPITGVEINDDLIIRSGRLSQAELETARLLLEDGDPRWLVAAKLGVFPLAFSGTGRKPERKRPPTEGGYLPRAAARNDPRQLSAYDLLGIDDTDEDSAAD